MPDSFDSPWKDALTEFLQPFLALLFPDVEAQVDWSQEVRFLETELRKLCREGEESLREADALVEVGLRTGERGRLWIHIEVQGQWQAGFSQRVYVGHHRVWERFGDPVCSLVVLADPSSTWRPDHFCKEGFGNSLEFRYPIAKLADYRARMDELEQSVNPFAVFVQAHLLTQDSQKNPDLRLEHKIRLVRGLYRRGLSRDDVVRLFRLVDWLLHLEPPYALQFAERMAEYEQEDKVPYVTFFEQLGIEKGREEGREEGLQRALARILSGRFGPVPPQIVDSLGRLSAAQLEDLSLLAATADSLATFQAGLPAQD